MRARVAAFFESSLGRNLVLAGILLNAALVGAGTYTSADGPMGALYDILDSGFLLLFTAEILLRLYAAGSARAYARDPWNLFDALLVAVCWMPGVGDYVSVGRTLRVLRTLRTVALFPSLRNIITALLRSLPGMTHVAMLLWLLVYVYSVIGTNLFGETVPHYFGSLHRTWLTLFQIVTLEGWNDILADVLAVAPWGWAYLVSYIFLGTFTLFNLFVGVIVGNLEEVTARREDETGARLAELAAEVRALRERMESGRG